MKKKPLLMAAVVVATIMLTGCASNKPEAPINTTVVQPQEQSRQVYNIPLEKQAKKTNTTEKESSKRPPSENINLENTMTPSLQQATSKVTVINKGDVIRAKIITTWNGHKQGYLKLHWIAPKKYCVSSSFPIMKYSDRKDYTWAEHTIDSKRCAGNWKAEVVTNDNTVLSITSILVAKAQLSTQTKKRPPTPNATTTPLTAETHILPPKYLNVKNWKSCTSSKQIGTYSQVCLPKQKPTLCHQEYWDAIQKTELKTC